MCSNTAASTQISPYTATGMGPAHSNTAYSMQASLAAPSLTPERPNTAGSTQVSPYTATSVVPARPDTATSTHQ